MIMIRAYQVLPDFELRPIAHSRYDAPLHTIQLMANTNSVIKYNGSGEVLHVKDETTGEDYYYHAGFSHGADRESAHKEAVRDYVTHREAQRRKLDTSAAKQESKDMKWLVPLALVGVIT